MMALPVAGMLAGAVVDTLAGWLGGGRRALAAGGLATAALLAALLGNGREWWGLKLSPNGLCAALYQGNPFVEAEGAGAAVAALCGENETVYVVGSEPEILWYARRKGATRFDIAYPLALATPHAAKYQSEALAALDAAPPAVVVATRTRLGFAGPPQVYEGYLAAVASRTLGAGYRLEWSFGKSQGGWVSGGTWDERARDGATLGVLVREGSGT